jgi:hypothetical protein
MSSGREKAAAYLECHRDALEQAIDASLSDLPEASSPERARKLQDELEEDLDQVVESLLEALPADPIAFIGTHLARVREYRSLVISKEKSAEKLQAHMRGHMARQNAEKQAEVEARVDAKIWADMEAAREAREAAMWEQREVMVRSAAEAVQAAARGRAVRAEQQPSWQEEAQASMEDDGEARRPDDIVIVSPSTLTLRIVELEQEIIAVRSDNQRLSGALSAALRGSEWWALEETAGEETAGD